MRALTTGIGSVPHRSVDEAVAFSCRFDVPFLPQVPPVGMIEEVAADGLPPAFPAFLRALETRRARVAKVQLAGPLTVTRAGGDPERVLPRAQALIRAVGAVGAAPWIFLDEPVLVTRPELGALESMARSLQAEGAWVGVHCCGETAWGPLLALGADLVSIDATLSLRSVLAETAACEAFFARGGTLGLGVIPTDGSTGIGVEAVRAALPSGARVVLTPACGLAGCSVDGAERIFEALKAFQPRF